MVCNTLVAISSFNCVSRDVSLGGVVWTQMGMGSAQAINAAWLTAKMEDHKRPVALAAYVMSIQLANFPGNQLFRRQGTSTPLEPELNWGGNC